MPAIALKLVMDDADFAMLTRDRYEWTEQDSCAMVRSHRFETVPPGGKPSMKWKWAYFLDPSYPAVILAKAFLNAWGHDYEAVIYVGHDDHPWVILTDYEPPEG